jgi:hypothetical protein
MPSGDGSTPDELANEAGENLTEIGVGPEENGDGTSAAAPTSPLTETARVQFAPPPAFSAMGVSGGGGSCGSGGSRSGGDGGGGDGGGAELARVQWRP